MGFDFSIPWFKAQNFDIVIDIGAHEGEYRKSTPLSLCRNVSRCSVKDSPNRERISTATM